MSNATTEMTAADAIRHLLKQWNTVSAHYAAQGLTGAALETAVHAEMERQYKPLLMAA